MSISLVTKNVMMRSSVEDRRNIIYSKQQYMRLDGVSHRNTYRRSDTDDRDRLHTFSTMYVDGC